MKRLLWLLAVLLLSAPALYAQAQPVTVIVVRHAEKEAQPENDPPLSAQGHQSVERLAAALRDAGITRIYTTPYARTRETAMGVAKVVNAPVEDTPISGRNIAAYGDSVAARARRDGGVILVVSHSNTMGAVISALGAPDVGEIPETDYNNLFIVSVAENGHARLIRSRY